MTTPALPDLLVLTDRTQLPEGRPLTDQVIAAVDGGARAVLLREKDLPRDDRRRLAEALLPVLHAVGGLLLVASDAGLAAEVGADGVHLAAADAMPHHEDRPAIVGRSAHRVDEVRAAEHEGAAYATCSPVFATRSKPGYGPTLGLAGLAAACAATGLPVYALGGVSTEQAARCRRSGAAGVAVMGEVMRSADPAAAVGALRAALDAAGVEPATGATHRIEAGS